MTVFKIFIFLLIFGFEWALKNHFRAKYLIGEIYKSPLSFINTTHTRSNLDIKVLILYSIFMLFIFFLPVFIQLKKTKFMPAIKNRLLDLDILFFAAALLIQWVDFYKFGYETLYFQLMPQQYSFNLSYVYALIALFFWVIHLAFAAYQSGRRTPIT